MYIVAQYTATGHTKYHEGTTGWITRQEKDELPARTVSLLNSNSALPVLLPSGSRGRGSASISDLGKKWTLMGSFLKPHFYC